MAYLSNWVEDRLNLQDTAGNDTATFQDGASYRDPDYR